MEMNNANFKAFSSWSLSAQAEKDLITEFITRYNAYGANEINTLGDLLKLRNTHFDAFNKMET